MMRKRWLGWQRGRGVVGTTCCRRSPVRKMKGRTGIGKGVGCNITTRGGSRRSRLTTLTVKPDQSRRVSHSNVALVPLLHRHRIPMVSAWTSPLRPPPPRLSFGRHWLPSRSHVRRPPLPTPIPRLGPLTVCRNSATAVTAVSVAGPTAPIRPILREARKMFLWWRVW
jgi:hypothetical protein